MFPIRGIIEFLNPLRVKYTWKTMGKVDLLFIVYILHHKGYCHTIRTIIWKQFPYFSFLVSMATLNAFYGFTWVLCAWDSFHWHEGDTKGWAQHKETSNRNIVVLTTTNKKQIHWHVFVEDWPLIGNGSSPYATIFEMQKILWKILCTPIGSTKLFLISHET
jgi:hypothetical protein